MSETGLSVSLRCQKLEHPQLQERGSRRGRTFSERGWRSSRSGESRRPLWAFHLQTLLCLDSVEAALPRCRPGSAEPQTRALSSLLHFSPERMGRKAAFFTPMADPGGAGGPWCFSWA